MTDFVHTYPNLKCPSYNTYCIYLLFQVLSLIERISKRDIGFWCWKLFIINYFKCYEVIIYALLYLNCNLTVI